VPHHVTAKTGSASRAPDSSASTNIIFHENHSFLFYFTNFYEQTGHNHALHLMGLLSNIRGDEKKYRRARAMVQPT
jgi:hypothetical protein